MKVLRDDVRQRIWDAARDEFLEQGYDGASMRSIARQAGMTVGNIYLYFTSKEALFDAIVAGPVGQLSQLLHMTDANEENFRLLVTTLHDVFIQNRVEFLILVTRSKGSRYETYKESIVDLAQRRLAELQPTALARELSGPIGAALVEGLLCMYHRFDGDEARLSENLFHFLNFMLRDMKNALPMEDVP